MLYELTSMSDAMCDAISAGKLACVGENTPNQEQVTAEDLQVLHTLGHIWAVTNRSRICYFVTTAVHNRFMAVPSNLCM